MEQAKSISNYHNDRQDIIDSAVSNVDFETILNVKNLSVNQRLNAFFHNQIKTKIGLRNYLYHIQNIIFSSFSKNNLAVIGNGFEDVDIIREKYNFFIQNILRDTWKNNDVSIKYFYINNGQLKEVVNNTTHFDEKPSSQIIYFNDATSKQTFDNFVASDENSTALSVCKSLACYSKEELVNAGSIVLLYGDAGTGKSHLVSAINTFYSSKGGQVFSISSGNFIRKYGEAVKTQNVATFQENIMKNEIIIIEDIDQLIGKNGTLAEIQKIINLAIDEKKYILLTSRVLPNDICEASVVLKNIISNAVSIKLKKQQNALKTSIAVNYICEKNIGVPISIVRDLVVNLDCNARELKNYIKKLAIVQSIRKIELNTSLAFEILTDDICQNQKKKKTITNEEIIELVAGYYGLQPNDLKSAIKQKDICKARSIAMYLMRDVNSANFQEIGKILNRNHSTVISGIKNVEKWLEEDKKIPGEIAELRNGLQKNKTNLF